MDYIRKLPLLLGLAGAIITGLVGHKPHAANNDTMAKMMVVMVIFYIIGLLIRRTILDTFDTHKQKEQERQEEEQRLLLEKREPRKGPKVRRQKRRGTHPLTLQPVLWT